MIFDKEISDLEAQAATAGITITELCRRADVARSTWTRWKSGDTTPTGRILGRLYGALPEKEPSEPAPTTPALAKPAA